MPALPDGSLDIVREIEHDARPAGCDCGRPAIECECASDLAEWAAHQAAEAARPTERFDPTEIDEAARVAMSAAFPW